MLKKRVFLRFLEDIDTLPISDFVHALDALKLHGLFKQQSIAKEIYIELLENRAQFLSQKHIEHFEDIYSQLHKINGT